MDDPALVETLAEQKLSDKVQSLLAAGWKWTEARVSFEHWNASKEFPQRLYPDGDDYTTEQKAQSGCIVTLD